MAETTVLLLPALAGLVSGVFTGLVPGIHPNTVIFVSLPLYLSTGTGLRFYAVFISSLSVTHTFHDFLPAIFLSSPDAESALSVINGRSAVEQGKGLEMFYYTVYGALTSLLPVVVISALSLIFLEQIYASLQSVMHYILLFFLFFIILDSRDKFSTLLVTVFAGTLGILSFESTVNQSFVFIPLFSGLFAVPAVLRSLKDDFHICDQENPSVEISEAFRGGLLGSLAGFIAGVVPGIGGALSTAFISPLMNESNKDFMSAMGAVNTTDIIFSIFALHILGKARSGVSVALQFFSKDLNLSFVLLITFLSIFPAAYIALKISKLYVNILEKLPIRKVLYLVLIVLCCISVYLTGFTGLLILITASLIGETSLRLGNRRACMAVLIVPAFLFFSGIGAFI